MSSGKGEKGSAVNRTEQTSLIKRIGRERGREAAGAGGQPSGAAPTPTPTPTQPQPGPGPSATRQSGKGPLRLQRGVRARCRYGDQKAPPLLRTYSAITAF